MSEGTFYSDQSQEGRSVQASEGRQRNGGDVSGRGKSKQSSKRGARKRKGTRSRTAPQRQGAQPDGQLRLPVDPDALRESLRELLLEDMRAAVLRTAEQLVEDAVCDLVGPRYARKDPDNPRRRYGKAKSSIYLDGQPVEFDRPRVRDTQANEEVSIEEVRALQSYDALGDDVKRLLIRGVSTRNYDEALNEMANGLGLQKSAVSEAFIEASQADLDALNPRRLEQHTFVAVYLDALGFAKTTVLAAMGIDTDGKKHLLGIREGATENARLTIDLLVELRERGLTLTDKALFIIDGAKALHKAVKDVYGEQAAIQRCIEHKKRNVLDYLPDQWKDTARRKLTAAYNMASYEEAKSELYNVIDWLEDLSESPAASSMREGLEETLTVHRLGITGALRRTLQTTNPLESIFGQVRERTKRVKRWRHGAMAMRWCASAMQQIEPRLHRVKGFRDLPLLKRNLAALTEEADFSKPCQTPVA